MKKTNLFTTELSTNPNSSSGWVAVSREGHPHSYIREESVNKISPKDPVMLALVENGAQATMVGLLAIPVKDYKETFIAQVVPQGESESLCVGGCVTLENAAFQGGYLAPDKDEVTLTFKPGEDTLEVRLDKAGKVFVEKVEG